jgi:predicted TIM-barrel fold metal-dependent hydrolase
MHNATDFQVQYDDHRREMAWVNDHGWHFDPPTTPRRVRETIARALITLAARLTPATEQPRTA